jgi:hypothetical protein
MLSALSRGVFLEEIVRPIIRLTLASLAVAAVACGRDSAPTTSMTDDLKNDLKLATSQPQVMQIAPDELAPKASNELSVRPKKNPGPKVTRSKKPTVKASAQPVEVAEVDTKMPDVQMVASGPSDSPNANSAPPMARPSPAPLPATGSAGRATGGENGSGSGIGTIGVVLGGILGGMARGGMAGGDDHCIPPGGAGGRIPRSGGGYGGNPMGTWGSNPRNRGGTGPRLPSNPFIVGRHR